MQFRRSLQRYGQTPEPVTPYQKAEQLWDERIGSARVQAKNWRLMAAGLVSQSRGTPYVVEVDRAVQVRAVGAAVTPYRPTDAQIAYHLARFVTDVCSLSTDPVVVRQNWLEAYQPCRRRTLY